MNPQPVTLTGTHVRLEPLALAHAEDLWAAFACDPSIWAWLPTEPPDSLAAMRALVADVLKAQGGEQIAFAQVDLASGKAVGGTRYLNISRRDRGLEIGFTWIGRPWQRTALNTEAKYLLLRHAFEELEAVRVQLKTDLRNLASQAAIERLGAVREGVLRKVVLVCNGHFRDSVFYSILAEEWPGVKARLEARMSQGRR